MVYLILTCLNSVYTDISYPGLTYLTFTRCILPLSPCILPWHDLSYSYSSYVTYMSPIFIICHPSSAYVTYVHIMSSRFILYYPHVTYVHYMSPMFMIFHLCSPCHIYLLYVTTCHLCSAYVTYVHNIVTIAYCISPICHKCLSYVTYVHYMLSMVMICPSYIDRYTMSIIMIPLIVLLHLMECTGPWVSYHNQMKKMLNFNWNKLYITGGFCTGGGEHSHG